MEDLIKHNKEIEEAPDEMFINGIKYKKVVPEKQKLSIFEIIARWEYGFSEKWSKKENQYNQVYVNEINRLIDDLMLEWLPKEVNHISKNINNQSQLNYWCGYNKAINDIKQSMVSAKISSRNTLD